MLDVRELVLVWDGEWLWMVKVCVGLLKYCGMEFGVELFMCASEVDALSDKAVSEGETYFAVGNMWGWWLKLVLVLWIMFKYLDVLLDGLVFLKFVEVFV